jgi:predicted nucleic acid-binding protein
LILVDSSAWVRLAGRPQAFAERAGDDDVALCPPVVQEVLQGAGTPDRYRKLQRTLAFAIILDDPLPLARFEEAAMLYLRCRAAAFTIRKSTDCLIAGCALAHDIRLLHDDRDFDHIAAVAPLKAVRV